MIADINDINKIITADDDFDNLMICERNNLYFFIFTYIYNNENYISIKSASKSIINSINTLEINIDDNKIFTDEYTQKIFINTSTVEVYTDNPLYNKYFYNETENYFYCTFINTNKEINTILFDINSYYDDNKLYRKKYLTDQNILLFDFKFDNTDADTFENCRLLDINFYEYENEIYTDFYWYSNGVINTEFSSKVDKYEIVRKRTNVLEGGYTININAGFNASAKFTQLVEIPSNSKLLIDNITYSIINYQILNNNSSYTYNFILRDINSTLTIPRDKSVKVIIEEEFDDEFITGHISIGSYSPKMIYSDVDGIFDRTNTDYNLISCSLSKSKSLMITYSDDITEAYPEYYSVLCYNKYIMYTTDNTIFDDDGLISFKFKIDSFKVDNYDEDDIYINTQNLFLDSYWISESEIMSIGYIDSGSEFYNIGKVNYSFSIYNDEEENGYTLLNTHVITDLMSGRSISTSISIDDFTTLIKFKYDTIFLLDNYVEPEFQFHNVFESGSYVTKVTSFYDIDLTDIVLSDTFYIEKVSGDKYKLIKYKIVPEKYINSNMILVKMLPLLPEYLQNNIKTQNIINVFEKIQNGNVETSNTKYDDFDNPILLGAFLNNINDQFMVNLLELNPTLYFYDKRNDYGLNPLLDTVENFKETNNIQEIDDTYLIDMIKNNGFDYLYDKEYFNTLMALPFYESDNEDFLNLNISTDNTRDVLFIQSEENVYKNSLIYEIPDIDNEIRNIFNILSKYTKYNSSKFFLELIVGLFSFNYSLKLSILTDNNVIDIDNLTFLGSVVDNKLYFEYDNNLLIKNMSGLTRSVKFIERVIKNFIPINFVYDGLMVNVSKSFNIETTMVVEEIIHIKKSIDI